MLSTQTRRQLNGNTKEEKKKKETRGANVAFMFRCFQLSECTFVHLKIICATILRLGIFRSHSGFHLKHWLINKLPPFSTCSLFHKFLKLPEKISLIWIPKFFVLLLVLLLLPLLFAATNVVATRNMFTICSLLKEMSDLKVFIYFISDVFGVVSACSRQPHTHHIS